MDVLIPLKPPWLLLCGLSPRASQLGSPTKFPQRNFSMGPVHTIPFFLFSPSTWWSSEFAQALPWVWSFGVPPFCGLCRCSLLCEQRSCSLCRRQQPFSHLRTPSSSSHLSTLSHSPHAPFSLPTPSSSLTFWLHSRRYRSFYAAEGLHSRTTISPLSFWVAALESPSQYQPCPILRSFENFLPSGVISLICKPDPCHLMARFQITSTRHCPLWDLSVISSPALSP
jgi:hypothetical protein